MAVQKDPSPTVLDRVIGWVNPRAGLSRYFDRQRLSRAYEAASPRDKWRPRRANASPDADHQADAAVMRGKARSLVQNVPYMRAAIDALVANTIGTGITTYSKETGAAKVDKLFADWMKVCDADGRLDWYGMQSVAYRAMEVDGEVLIRLRWRRPDDGLPVPLQLQLLEIDWLDRMRTGPTASGRIVNGIEYDLLGRVVAYWLFNQHPGDVMPTLRNVGLVSRRVLAEDIIHLSSMERPGQGRGFTRLAPVISRVRDLQLYEDAELARKNQESRLSVLASGDPTMMANPETFGGQADPAKAASTGELGMLSSGGITLLPPGLNLTTLAPHAAPGTVEYIRHNLHIIAVGVGVTFEMMTGDMGETNFSGARVRLIDFRRQVETMQWLTLVPRLILPVWRAFIQAGKMANKLPQSMGYECDHSMPKWDYVNPEQDAAAEVTLMDAGLLSPVESLRRRGFKSADVIAEYKKWVDELKAAGLYDHFMMLQRGKITQTENLTPGFKSK